jgi:hypothetical protein
MKRNKRASSKVSIPPSVNIEVGMETDELGLDGADTVIHRYGNPQEAVSNPLGNCVLYLRASR